MTMIIIGNEEDYMKALKRLFESEVWFSLDETPEADEADEIVDAMTEYTNKQKKCAI